jgi:hypothetical protein
LENFTRVHSKEYQPFLYTHSGCFSTGAGAGSTSFVALVVADDGVGGELDDGAALAGVVDDGEVVDLGVI